MTKLRIWMFVILVLIVGFLSIGFFRPSSTISTEFKTSRSAATSFRVLTTPANIGSFFLGQTQVESVVESDNQLSNRYRVEQVDRPHADVSEFQFVRLDEIDQFTFQVISDSRVAQTTYSFFNIASGTRITVSHLVSPTTWIGRSLLPLNRGFQVEEQQLIHANLARLIESSPESLIGDWISVSSTGEEQMFTFKNDGTLNWRVSVGDEVFPLTNIHWNRETSVQPELLDLSGFTSGPLRGLTLFGIVDMSRRDTLIFDAEAGLPDDDRVRPTTFSASTATYVRIR